ncbi:MAG: hypothetical protein HOI95_00935 [Chromatiales bacterium]|nr:hypothetical protein [Chromatiales bacterium]
MEILQSIYEVDFAAFSYGFRPGKSQHQCLQALQTALQKGRVNWVLDLDLKACFDSIEHDALMDLVEKRVKDRTLLRLIGKWLTVGYRDDNGQRHKQRRGTPQGAPIPIAAGQYRSQRSDGQTGPSLAATTGTRRGVHRALRRRWSHRFRTP